MKKFLIIVIVLLVGARLALPYGLKWYANRMLDKNPDYDGHIEDVDVHLWRGAYAIEGIRIVKTTGQVKVPFFRASEVDLAISWKDLLEGAVVARVRFVEPEVNFVDAKKKANKQAGTEGKWSSTLEELVPFRINRLVVEDGAVHFRNFESKPPVDIWVRNLDAEVTNLTNIAEAGEELFAHCRVKGTALGGAKLDIDLKLDPRWEKPSFDLNAKLLNLQLTELNPFFEAYGSLDFEKGEGDIVAEVTARKGKLSGYVKPLFRGIDILSLKKDAKEGDNVLELAWQAVAGTVAELLENQKKDQLATKIPIEGNLNQPNTDVLATVGGVLRNAFVQAFAPFYEGQGDKARARKAE